MTELQSNIVKYLNVEDLMKFSNKNTFIRKFASDFSDNYELSNYINSDSKGIYYKGKIKNIGKEIYFSFYIKKRNKKFSKNSQNILHHNNIANNYGSYKINDNLYFTISEFSEYGNLENFQKTRLKNLIFSESFINYLARPILEGLNYSRRCQVIHMDIKKDNIILDSILNPKITDFSSSFSFEGYKPNDIIKLPVIGTGRYMAPEILNEKELEVKYVDKIDIYSLGVTLYNLAFGCYPYELNNIGENDYESIKERLNNENLVFPNNNNISEMFKNFLKNILEKDYNKRYNIKEALEDPWIKGWEIINEEKENIVIEENLNYFCEKLVNNGIPEFNEYINNSY